MKPEEIARGVQFNLAVDAALKMNLPGGTWGYRVSYLDPGAVSSCGIDLQDTILWKERLPRIVGTLDSSLGDVQIDLIYKDGYRFELSSRYPLEKPPEELAEWGVEFEPVEDE